MAAPKMKSSKSNWLTRAWSRLASGRKQQPAAVSARRRAFFLESLEDRRTMAANLNAISTQTVLGGSPLWLPLNGTSDINGAALTYTVTISNSTVANLLQTSIPTGNRSAKISVENGPATTLTNKSLTSNVATLGYTGIKTFAVGMTVTVAGVDSTFDGTYTITAVSATGNAADNINTTRTFSYAKTAANVASTASAGTVTPVYGDMTFELFENLAPRATQRFIDLATGTGLSAPFYNDTATNTVNFHRVIDGFVIQGGDPTNTGSGGSPLPDFDDQFSLDLQHNRGGLLSMAKSLDDTNDSQFFVTEAATRWLDFQHSIFGLLTTGESVREAISNVAKLSGTNTPATPVTIGSVTIFQDLQNRVLELKAANGASGEADVTVTVNDGSGVTSSRTFHVVVTPDTNNNSPFLQEFTSPRVVSGTTGTFQIPATDAEGDAIYYDAKALGAGNHTVSVDHTTGVVTVTPAAGFVGTFQVQIGVKDPNTAVVVGAGETQLSAENRVFDYQTINVVVAPPAPTSIDLLAASDSGSSSTDNITNAGTLQFLVSGVSSGDTVKLYADGTLVGTATATGATITMSTSLVASLGQGAHQITATRTAGGSESAATTPLTVIYDTTAPPAFTSTPPTSATTTQLLSYNAQNPEEANAGFTYELSAGAPAGAAINSSGLLTWTPTTGQTGSFQFSIIAKDAAGNATNQAVNINVAPFTAPVVDVQFVIVDSATSNTPITQITAGSTFYVVVKAKELPSHSVSITNKSLSSGSATLTMSAKPVFSVGMFVTISGVDATFNGTFRVTDIDLNANTFSYDLDGADLASTATTGSVAVTPTALVAFYNDITFDSAAAQINGNIRYAPDYDILSSGTGTPGLINEAGAASSSFLGATGGNGPPVQTDYKEIYRVPIKALRGGQLTFSGDPADDPDSTVIAFSSILDSGKIATLGSVTGGSGYVDGTYQNVQLTGGSGSSATANITVSGGVVTQVTLVDGGFEYAAGNILSATAASLGGSGSGFSVSVSTLVQAGVVQPNQIIFNSASVQVQASFTPGNDTITNVTEDTSNNTLNVLTNDLPVGSTETLTIVSIGAQPNHGGTVTISLDGKSLLYTPASNFDGVETFTYVAQNSLGEQATGMVTVNIQPLNDPPVANNESLTATEGQTTLLDVLANDNPGPDSGQTVKILRIDSSTAGAVVSLADGDTRISYKPPANVTTDTITYTITDGNGGTATATATITIAPTNDPPIANPDTVTVLEDSTNNTISVLTNDSDPEGGALTITVVSNISSGGTVTISADKKTLIYAPAPNFQGLETFSYTITDGTNITTGQVQVTVTNVNDPPTAVNDTATTYRNSTGVLIDVLANDFSTPDVNETRTIATLGTPAHGTAAIDAATGKVKYTPAAGYSGSDSFTYVITDGQLTSQATVTITIAPYQSTYVSGQMFFDANNNGVQDRSDGPLAGVGVTLQGTDLSGAAFSQTATSDANGYYRFDTVYPGTYALKQGAVPATGGGAAMVGSQGGTVQDANQINLTITPEAAAAGLTNYVFTEQPQQANLGVSTGKASLLAKRVTSALSVAVSAGNSASWLTPTGTGWTQLASIQASLSTDGKTLQVTTKDGAAVTHQTSVSVSDSRVRLLGQQSGLQVLQLRGDPSIFGLSGTPVTNSGSSSGGSTSPLGTNQGPVNTLPVAQTLILGNTLTFSSANGNALSISDADAGTSLLQVVLSASHGKLSLSGSTGLTFSSGSATNVATMTFSGTQSAINAALNGAVFTPDSGYTGAASVNITTNDLGHSGTGGALIDIDALAITVTTGASGEGEGESFAAAADEFFNSLA